MAPSQTLYPRATVKRIVKAHSNRPLSKNADIMVNNQRASIYRPAQRRESPLIETTPFTDLPRLHALHERVRKHQITPLVPRHLLSPRPTLHPFHKHAFAGLISRFFSAIDGSITQKEAINSNIGNDCNRLIREASIKSKQSGERGISARSVRKVREVSVLPFVTCQFFSREYWGIMRALQEDTDLWAL